MTRMHRMPSRAIGAFITTLLMAAAILTGATSAHAAGLPIETGPPAPGVKLSGVIDHGPVSDTANFGAWRGRPSDVIVDYLGGNSWSSIENTTWTQGKWAGVKAHYVWSMFMLPLDGSGNMHSCAATLYNSHFVKAGQGLVNAGYANSTIRIGWELTGNWFKWGNLNDNKYFYASCWRNIVRSLRSVPGQHFTFDWNLSDQHQDPTIAYPGDAYVDYVGGDFYDNGVADTNDHVGSWNAIATKPYGLNWLADFAAQHGKRVSIPEWAVEYRCAGNWSGGDDPYYIEQMHQWVETHDVAYEAYFNDSDNSCQQFALDSGLFPKARAAYHRLF